MAEAPLTPVTVALPRQRDSRPGGPYGHNNMTASIDKTYSTPPWRSKEDWPTGSRRQTLTPRATQHSLSQPLGPVTLTISLSLPAPQEPDSEDEDTNMDTDATYDMSFHQEGDLTLLDTTVYAAIVELLLELEGVDPEPDFWARSSKGPWHIGRHNIHISSQCTSQNNRFFS